MRQFWKTINARQRQRREQAVVMQDGCVMNGCVPQDDFAEEVREALDGYAVEFGTAWESGDMPVFRYNDEFKTWRAEQIEENRRLVEERITCTLPWQVLKHLDAGRKDSDRLYWSQGGLGSCFPYHQKVYTQEGAKTIGELLDAEKEFIVLSYSKRLGRIAAKQAYVYKTGKKECLRITTDKGTFDATVDHPFMLRTREFVKAENLKPGMSLYHASTLALLPNDFLRNTPAVRVL